MPISTYGSTLYEEYGAWQAFVNPNGSGESYFDDQGNEWATGTGPAPTLGSGNAYTGFDGGAANASTTVPISSAASQPTPVASTTSSTTSSILSSFSSEFTNLESLLTGSVIGGIPNWVLAGGVVVAFMFFGEKSNGRK